MAEKEQESSLREDDPILSNPAKTGAGGTGALSETSAMRIDEGALRPELADPAACEESLEGFLAALASAKATPGGGGAAALAGALGAALGSMVVNLTRGKKKYAEHEAALAEALDKAEALRRDLKSLIAADAEAFAPLAKAYGLPKSTPEEIAEKERIMEAALARAAAVPLEIMEKGLEGLRLQALLAQKGSRLAISDVACGARLLEAAVACGEYNVYINTGLMKDRQLAARLEARAAAAAAESRGLTAGICDQVLARIRR